MAALPQATAAAADDVAVGGVVVPAAAAAVKLSGVAGQWGSSLNLQAASQPGTHGRYCPLLPQERC